ncbi:MAG TPA: amino acid transport protein [Gammaproteobacteria bacterium]|nr:amino acid transport protein [Gammaproteobacteria bacterium]
MHTASLLLSLLISSLGVGYFIYGRRQSRGAALLSGGAMAVYPMFVSNVWIMLALGAAFAAAPFLLDF